MSRVPSVAWLDGRLVPWSEACLPLEDRGLQFAESLYEVLPITAGRARLVERHVERMRRGAEWLELADGLPDPAAWGELTKRLIEAEELDEGLFYAQLTGGSTPRSHLPDHAPRPVFFAYLQPLRFPREEQLFPGIRAVTLPDTRWEHCHIKTTMLLPSVLSRREAARRGAEEALLVGPDGAVREGTSCNVLIVEGNRVSCPTPNDHVLPGITLPLVTELARAAGYEVAERRIPLAELRGADEVFVTSTSRLVFPVVVLDDTPLGGGRPGPVTLDLARRMRERLELT